MPKLIYYNNKWIYEEENKHDIMIHNSNIISLSELSRTSTPSFKIYYDGFNIKNLENIITFKNGKWENK